MRPSTAPGPGVLLVIVLSALAGTACSAVPELSFGEEGEGDAASDARLPTFGGPPGDAGIARADAAPPPVDSGTPVAMDAGAARDAASPPAAPDAGAPLPDASSVPDAGPPAPPVDAGPPVLACPDAPPAGADLCCDAVPCVGKKCAQVCAECSTCAGQVCCAAPNGKSATCAATTAACTTKGKVASARDEDDGALVESAAPAAL